MAEGYGPSLPLKKDKSDGYEMRKTLKEEARQNLIHLFLCQPGERVMMPNFGIGIKSFLFEQQSPQLYTEIRNRIKKQVKAYLTHVTIEEIQFGGGGQEFSRGAATVDSNVLAIRVIYRLSNSPGAEELIFKGTDSGAVGYR